MTRIEYLKSLLSWVDQLPREAYLLAEPGFDRAHVDSLVALGGSAAEHDVAGAIKAACDWISAVPAAIKAGLVDVPSAPTPIFNGHLEDLHTIIAALRFWQRHGMCEPFNRTDEFQDLATGGDMVTSLCDEDVDALVEELNFSMVLG